MPASRKVFIIGAARSGTKLLRALLAAHPRAAAVPFDVNFVWKYDNYALPHDELAPADASPRAREFIRRFMERQASGHDLLVEKTVSNALRVPFIRELFPDALFVHLVRDGRAVAESARRMWQAPADWRQAAKKLGVFPFEALPRYATQYVLAYAARRARRGERVTTWGPRFRDIDRELELHPLLDVCGEQWLRCVEAARRDLDRCAPGRSLEIRYEELVRDAEGVMSTVFDHVGLDFASEARTAARTSVRDDTVDAWRTRLDARDIEALVRRLGPTLATLGYT